MKVYVVRWGRYSESGTLGIFYRREDAEEVARARNKNAHEWLGYGVTEYEVRSSPLGPPTLLIRVGLENDDWTVDKRFTNPEVESWPEGGDHFWLDRLDGKPEATVWIEVNPDQHDFDRDEGKMIKIAQDRFAKWKAEQEGIA